MVSLKKKKIIVQKTTNKISADIINQKLITLEVVKKLMCFSSYKLNCEQHPVTILSCLFRMTLQN